MEFPAAFRRAECPKIQEALPMEAMARRLSAWRGPASDHDFELRASDFELSAYPASAS
jgi:hypothetical protein